MRNISQIHKALASALALILLLQGSLPAHSAYAADEQGPERSSAQVEMASLPDNASAEDYANKLIAQYQSQDPGNEAKTELVLLHLGDAPPTQLKWVILKLDAAHIPHRLLLLPPSELEQILNDKGQEAERLILVQTRGQTGAQTDVKTANKQADRVRSITEKARLFARQLMGLPNGLTLWFFNVPALGLKSSPLLRTDEQKSKERRNATFQSVIGTVSVWATYYIKTHEFYSLSAGIGMAAFMSWLWIWVYYARSWSDVMTQGKAIKEVRPNEWKIVNSDLSYYLLAYFRGLITNAIVLGILFHGDILNIHTAVIAATNSGINLFAKGWIDKWISDHQATTLPDGQVIQKEGQHSPATSIQIRFWWEFGYGFVKNLQLAGYSRVLDTAYVLMGSVGVAKKAYDERFNLKRKLTPRSSLGCESAFE